jgi:hypothetical protein
LCQQAIALFKKIVPFHHHFFYFFIAYFDTPIGPHLNAGNLSKKILYRTLVTLQKDFTASSMVSLPRQ